MLASFVLSFFSLAPRGDDSDLDLTGDESLEELLFFDTDRDDNACIGSILPNSDDGVVDVLENENGSDGISSILILSLVSLSIIISAFNKIALGFNLMLGIGLDERDSNFLLSIFSLPLSYVDFDDDIDDDDIDNDIDDDDEGKKVGMSIDVWLN